jgi:hypothetical protein
MPTDRRYGPNRLRIDLRQKRTLLTSVGALSRFGNRRSGCAGMTYLRFAVLALQWLK